MDRSIDVNIILLYCADVQLICVIVGGVRSVRTQSHWTLV